MGFIDWLILIMLAVSAFMGYRKGIAAMLVRLGGAVALFLLIGQIFPLVRNALIENFKLGLVLSCILAAILIIVAAVVILGLLAKIFTKALKVVRLSAVNRFLGLVMGFVNGLVSVIILMVLLDYAPKLSEPLKDHANHRVYAAMDVFKEDIFDNLKMNEHNRFNEIREKQKKDNNQSGQNE
ncbi:MAG: CvpA family protein [Desulfobulbus sp.]|jgi:membrane protein required for colicin V production|nr:CvpA family protein [Desulfobulbus sp.]NLN85918.1 CvpA family protein [Candidatus Cloacimonadota bacterium]